MNQTERQLYLIDELLKENNDYKKIEIPTSFSDRQYLLRGLLNLREPKDISKEFIDVEDQYLKEELNKKGVIDIKDLTPIKDNIYLWQGDITSLKVDAIVNAANKYGLGCFYPNHKCIDNCIHTYAGIKLRNKCNEIMNNRNSLLDTSEVIITEGYNLPCKYIIHTVGPIIYDKVSDKEIKELRDCYLNSLNLAKEYKLDSIAFCCISTGEFHFPNNLAAEIAVDTVKEYLKSNDIKVVFNVFKDEDKDIYERILK